jgi:serine/threonine protein kinase
MNSSEYSKGFSLPSLAGEDKIMHVCLRCSKENQIDARFCHWCGEFLLVGSATGTLPSQTLLNAGRYAIIQLIGQGGMGAVYKALDLFSLQQRVIAIKEMSQIGLSSQELREAIAAFIREAEILASLNHPCLPRIYQQFEENGRHYLAMDFIEGVTLEQHWRTDLQSGKLMSVKSILNIGIQLCAVLDYLHIQQPPIIFRDLKPANIMLTPQGKVYLIDFGIARFFRPGQTKDTVALGSPGYASPEQYRNVTSPQSDIYSLGVVLHQLLTGNDPSLNPFHFKSFSINIPLLEGLVIQMVKGDKALRPASMKEVQRVLDGIAAQKLIPGKTGTNNSGKQDGKALPDIRPLNIHVLVSSNGEDQSVRKSIQDKLESLIEAIPNVRIHHSAALSQGDSGTSSNAIDQADLILMLLSKDFLASSTCMADAKRAIDRARRSGVSVLSLLLHRCAWQQTDLVDVPLAFPDALTHRSLYAQELRLVEAARSVFKQLVSLMMMGKPTGSMNLLKWLLWQLYGSGVIDCPYFVVGRYALKHVRSSGRTGMLLHLIDLQTAQTIADYPITSHTSMRLTGLLHTIAPSHLTPLDVEGVALHEQSRHQKVR